MRGNIISAILISGSVLFSCRSSQQTSKQEHVPLEGHWKSFREIRLDKKGHFQRELLPKNHLVISKRGAFRYWTGTEADTADALRMPYLFNQKDSLLLIGSKKLEDLVDTGKRPLQAEIFKAYLQKGNVLVLHYMTYQKQPKPTGDILYLKKIKWQP